MFLRSGERQGRALRTHGDVQGSGQAPPRRIGGNVSPTEELKDEARLGAALLNYGALVCKNNRLVVFARAELRTRCPL